MSEQQHFLDLKESGSFGGPKSWLLGEDQSSLFHSEIISSSLSNGNANNGNVDRVLYRNLVEKVPLVESLMDRKAKNYFTLYTSLVYTKVPSRKSFLKKVSKLQKKPG